MAGIIPSGRRVFNGRRALTAAALRDSL